MDKETMYARWLNNELSEDEIQQLKSSGEWAILESIIKETDTWKLPEIEQDQYERIRAKIQSNQNRGEPKVVPINRWTWAYRAASVAVIVSLVYWFFFRPDFAEYQNFEGTSTIQLPDSTEIKLIGRSRVRYDKKNFARARKVKLEGRVYLAVRKKGPFTASFDGGEVQVLGTQFEILAGDKLSRVKCYEGRVKVLADGKPESILNPGNGVRMVQGNTSMITFQFEAETPDGLEYESIFSDAPLEEVLEALQIQFNVEFDAGQIDVNRRYSGKFVHGDLQKSLDMVLTPMGIEYRIEAAEKKKIILQ
jgi:ferric-dicitrate binding protein FerR (iron transport regulator)